MEEVLRRTTAMRFNCRNFKRRTSKAITDAAPNLILIGEGGTLLLATSAAMTMDAFRETEPFVHSVRGLHRTTVLNSLLKCVGVVFALLCCSNACAETRVYLLRGWFGVFSTGMDSVADKLRADGIKAETIMHFSWRSTVSTIVNEWAAGETGPLVLVGHSQGANNAIDMARELDRHKLQVDLLITLVPFLQDPVPSNVVQAINYYQSPGWGMPLTADPGFRGELSNVNIASDLGTFHVTIDKSSRIQSEILSAIKKLSR